MLERRRGLVLLIGLAAGLALGLTACSGSRNEELNARCKTSLNCEEGQLCSELGVCMDPALAQIDGGSQQQGDGPAQIRAVGRAQGVDAVVQVRSQGGTCADSACAVELGATVSFEAAAVAGYRFSGWSGDPACVGDQPNLTLNDVRSDVQCIANYVKRWTASGTVEGGGASVSASSEALYAACDAERCEVDRGATVTLTAPARDGFRFAGWTGDGCTSTTATLQIPSVESDLSCVASYVARFRVQGASEGAAPLPTIVATSADTSANCVGPSCEVDAQGSVTLRAPSVSGYRFTGWSGDCAGQGGVAVTLSEVTRDMSCTARYVRGVSVSGAAVGANTTVTAQSSSAGASCSGASCAIDAGGSVSLSVGNVVGTSFTGWTGDPECSSTALAITLSNVTSSKSCIANFSPLRYRVAASVAGGVGGTIASSSNNGAATCNSSGCTVDYDSSVTLTASPSAGYDFSGWTGCTSSSALTITRSNVRADQTCTASFTRRSYNVQLSATLAATKPVTMTSDSGGVCNGNSCNVPVLHGNDVVLHLAYDNVETTDIPTSWGACQVRSTTPEGIGRFAVRLGPITASGTCAASFVGGVSMTFIGAAQGTLTFTSPYCSPNTSNTVQCGVPVATEVRVTAVPNQGLSFRNWLCFVTSLPNQSMPSTANPIAVSLATPDSIACIAQFATP